MAIIVHSFSQSKGKTVKKAEVDKLHKGKSMGRVDAYKHKLVDQLGDFDTAVDKARASVTENWARQH